MTLVKNGVVVDDPWRRIDEDAQLPQEGSILVSSVRWREEKVELAQRNSPLGLWLLSDDPLESIRDALESVDLIAIEFPAFTDGRPYSTARLLRERYHFAGELRAFGEILRDQAQFMLRCGFDNFELGQDADVEDWLAGLSEIAVHYQPAADRRLSAAELRHQ